MAAANEYARKIDIFLIAREQSVFSKLVALGGSAEEESFEVQVKVKLADPATVLEAIKKPEIEILRNEALPPARCLLYLRRSGSRLAALS